MAGLRILLVEANTIVRETVEINLLLEGFDVDAAESLTSSVAVASRARYDAVILGLDAADPTVADQIMAVKNAHPNQHLLIVGGDDLPRTTNTRHMARPVDMDEVLHWLDSLQVGSLLPA